MTVFKPCLLALAGALVWTSPVWAQDRASVQSDVAFDFDAAVPRSPQELAQVRAGTDTTYQAVSAQTLAATNSGNSVTAEALNTGQIGFSSGSLSGFSGIGNFVLNTGNNNNLQGAITINVVVSPTH